MQAIRRRLLDPIILFTTSRYVVYILLFFRGLLLAKYLGPYLFGIYGFISMMQWYLLSIGLGVNYAINVELSTQDDLSKAELFDIINNALLVTAIIGLIVIFIGAILHIFNIHLFEKYLFYRYVLILGCITSTNLIQQVLINVYRYYNKLFRIAFVELFSASLLLLIALTYKDLQLIDAILIGILMTGLISIVILLIDAPFKLSFQLKYPQVKTLLKIGIPLLIYNVSFLMMNIIAQTIISVFYSVETMGYYTLANNIAVAILLGINSITWIIYPDILFRTREGLNENTVMQFLDKLTDVYSVSVYITIYISLFMFPLLYLYLPQYKPTYPLIVILLFSQAVLSYCFGYNCLAIARKKHKIVATQSILSVLIVAILSCFVVIVKLSYVWIAVSVLFASYIFNILQTKAGINIILNHAHSYNNKVNGISFGNIIVIIICLSGSVSHYPGIITLLSFMLYVYLNKNKLIRAYGIYAEIIQSRIRR